MPGPPRAQGPHGLEAWRRSRRLLRRSEFRAAYDHGVRRSSPHFTLFGLPRPRAQAGAAVQVGITVTRKQGGAVVRNRIRRRTRELLRRLPAWPVASARGWNVVINPRTSVADADFRLLAAELEMQLRRLGTALEAMNRDERGSAAVTL